MSCPARIFGFAGGVSIDELDTTRNHSARISALPNRMIDKEHDARVRTKVCRIDENRTLFQLVSTLFQNQIGNCLHQWMCGMQETRHGRPDTIHQTDILFLKAHTFVAREDGIEIPAVSPSQLPVALANGRRYVSD